MLVFVKLATGAPMLPPCWLKFICGVTVPFAVKLLPVSVISVPMGPEVGLNEAIVGAAAFEKMTLSLTDEAFPATSVALTVIVLAPDVSATEQLKAPLWTVAAAPLQVT